MNGRQAFSAWALGAYVLGAAVLLAVAMEIALQSGWRLEGSMGGPVALAVETLLSLCGLAIMSARANRAVTVIAPLVFAAQVLFLWDTMVRGYEISAILLPTPAAIALAIHTLAYDLALDFWQTFVREALPGFALGSFAGLLLALAVDRSSFIRRGLAPLAQFFSVIPTIGIAPIMVMWFGFDWPSKAAVVALMTFFPMLVNASAGLQAAGAIELDVMASYSATYGQTLFKLRLPSALPFLFAALKVNTSLAVVGAIVAEFFGAPIRGFGFRISAEIGRFAMDHVWAVIVVAAVTGAAFYGALAEIERVLTFWHPSVRETRA
jgi:NitT/TauT family transport system permease protein